MFSNLKSVSANRISLHCCGLQSGSSIAYRGKVALSHICFCEHSVVKMLLVSVSGLLLFQNPPIIS